jgi:hypothetical protein
VSVERGIVTDRAIEQLATRRANVPPLAERPRQPITIEVLPDSSPPVTQRATIRVQPTLLAAMLRAERVAIGRIWLLCRHLDQQGRGWLTIDQLRAELSEKSAPLRVCGWRRLRQLLRAGEGRLWERDQQGRLWLYGTARVAQRFDLTRLQGNCVDLPVGDLLQTIGRVRASFYACFHAGREATPISRDSLQTITGIAARTQRDYDQHGKVERIHNFAILETQEKEVAMWEHGRAVFAFTESTVGRPTQWACRLPNSYIAAYQTSATDGTKPLNHQLRHDLAKHGTQGNTSQRNERLYFTNGRQAAKQQQKQAQLYLRLHERKHLVIWRGWQNGGIV